MTINYVVVWLQLCRSFFCSVCLRGQPRSGLLWCRAVSPRLPVRPGLVFAPVEKKVLYRRVCGWFRPGKNMLYVWQFLLQLNFQFPFNSQIPLVYRIYFFFFVPRYNYFQFHFNLFYVKLKQLISKANTALNLFQVKFGRK